MGKAKGARDLDERAEDESGNRIRFVGLEERSTEGHKNEWKYATVFHLGQGEPLERIRHLECGKFLEFKGMALAEIQNSGVFGHQQSFKLFDPQFFSV